MAADRSSYTDKYFRIGILVVCVWIVPRVIECCEFGPGCRYVCHCEDDAACDAVTGDCPAGCDDGDRNSSWWPGAWGGPACQVGNIAYQKDVTLTGTTVSELLGEYSVDGHLDRDINNGFCTYLFSRDIPPQLSIDFGNVYLVYNLTIVTGILPTTIGVDLHVELLADTIVEVGLYDTWEFCGYIEHSNVDNLTITCARPTMGNEVRLRRNDSVAVNAGYMALCEVMVTGYYFQACADNHFGPGCVTPCHCTGDCHFVSGECSSLCESGWQGVDCQTPCAAGTWGSQCSNTCNCLFATEACARVNGSCMSGCHNDYVGLGCDIYFAPWQGSISVIEIMESSMTLVIPTWPMESGNANRVSSYSIQRRTDGSPDWVNVGTFDVSLDNSQSVTHVLDGLDRGTTYHIRVYPVLDFNGEVYLGAAQDIKAETAGDGEVPWLIIVIVVAIFVLLLIMLAIALVIAKRRRRKKMGDEQSDTIQLEAQTYDPEQAPDDDFQATQLRGQDDEAVLFENHALDVRPQALAIERIAASNASLDNSEADNTEYENLYENNVSLSRPVKVGDLADYIQAMQDKPDGFKDEFMKIPIGQTAQSEVGNMPINRPKHRFINVSAYDHSRVKLSSTDEGKGYINANYIPGYGGKEHRYVAAQGPKCNTIVDTWRMVWQTKANRIIMVANIMEAFKAKCEPYWPFHDGETVVEHGEFTIKLVKFQTYADFVIRHFLVQFKDESRDVMQYHFTGWPDHGVPLIPTSLLAFHRKVRAYDEIATGPMIVHCSAGVGRTGTFLGLDYLLEQAREEGIVDVLKYTTLMRAHRINMVQNLEQYEFVYIAVLQALESGDTTVACAEFKTVYESLTSKREDETTLLEKQYKVVNRIRPDFPGKDQTGYEEENRDKNRDADIFPPNRVRPCLRMEQKGQGDYVNAAYIDGFSKRGSVIVTQLPLENTVQDFWRLMSDHRSQTIITLDDLEEEDKGCPRYWPESKEKPLTLGPLTVELLSTESISDGNITVRDFQITLTDYDPVKVRQCHLHGWDEKEDLPPNTDDVLHLLDHVESWQQKTAAVPVTVQCKVGVRHSGLICAAMYVLEQLKVDQEIDVFLAVSQIRLGRPQFIVSYDQYTYLHELAIAYMDRNDDYANFK